MFLSGGYYFAVQLPEINALNVSALLNTVLLHSSMLITLLAAPPPRCRAVRRARPRSQAVLAHPCSWPVSGGEGLPQPVLLSLLLRAPRL